MSDERIIVDPKTGGKKGQKKAQFGLIPPEFLWALAEHYGYGAAKYGEPRNWERGYAWSLCVDALGRHLNKWLRGESIEPESGSHHLIAVAWHAAALFTFEVRGLGTDDVRLPSIRQAARPIETAPSVAPSSEEDEDSPCNICGKPTGDTWLCDECAEQEYLWTWRPEDDRPVGGEGEGG